DYHPGPLWFYVPVLLLGCLPWSGLLPSLTRFLFSRSASVRALRPPALGFWLLWAGWCVLFFSLSRGKLPPYILPALPPVALLLGCYLDLVVFPPPTAEFLRRARTAVPRQAVVILATAWLAANLWVWSRGLINPLSGHELFETGFCVACLVGMGLWGKRLPPRAAWGLCGALGVAVVLATANAFGPGWS